MVSDIQCTRLTKTGLLCNFMRLQHDDTSAGLMRSPASPLLLLIGLLAYLPPSAWGQTTVSACPFDRTLSAPRAPRVTPLLEGPVFVEADQLRALGPSVREFMGDVELRRGEGRLSAQFLRYDQDANRIEARDGVELSNTAGDRYRTDELQLFMDSRTGHTGQSEFTLAQPPARGTAKHVEFDGPDKTRFERVSFTTCQPGQDSWFLHSRELTLDTAEDLGTAYHAWVQFQGVPIFYFPYVNFPISDRRKSGFLYPSVGYSDKLGAELATPYYFNLAPNYDDTLTPRLLSDRGLQVRNEFRHMSRASQTHFEVEYLAHDRVYGDDRAAGVFKHRNQLTRRWSSNIDARRVSDSDYLNDFGDNINIASQSYLPQIAETLYFGEDLKFTARVADYQTIDPTVPDSLRPYTRLPQLILAANSKAVYNRPQWLFDGEWNNFERDNSVTGGRLNLSAGAALPLANSYAFFTPRVLGQGIQYNLRDITGETTPSTSAGIASVDSGLIFERQTWIGGRGYVQTLEPRVYYLYVPYRDQDQQPNFDTTLPDFTFLSLFRDNRFVGGDRIGDANQASLALTSRFLDERDGVEHLRLSLGQIFYFADQRVGLPASGSAPGPATIGVDDRPRSDIVAEIGARLLGNWYGQATVQVDDQNYDVQKHGVYVQYQPARDRILNLGERYTRDQIRQTDISAQWPLGADWTVMARSVYSQRDHRNVESYLGLEYNSCCWALRLFGAQRYDRTEDRQVASIQLQLQLAGFSKVGSVPDSPLRDGLFYDYGTTQPLEGSPP